jgi:ankyrin repeat protein
MAESQSYELVAITRTPLQNKDTKSNLANSLVGRRYADIDWIKWAVQQKNENINCRDTAGRPLLQVILQVPWQGRGNDMQEGLTLLIESGASVDLQDRCGQTALHVAVQQGVPTKALQTLVKRSGNVNATDCHDKTPLHLLLVRSDPVDSRMLEILLAAGADPFCSSVQMDCPLLLLLNKPETLIKNVRLFNQIRPQDESSVLRTLLHRAVSCNTAVVVDLLLQEVGCVSALFDPGELLTLAARSSQDSEIKIDLLLKHGVDLEETTSSGLGLPHIAALTGSLPILQKATTGINTVIDKTDSDGNTPLHYAVSSESSDQIAVDCVNYLVSIGASTGIENKRGYSPLDTALSLKKKACVVVLVRAGSRLPNPKVARTLTIDQLSLLADFDVIAAFKNPVVDTLKMSGLVSKMSTVKFNIQRAKYRELSQQLEKTAAEILKFGIRGVSEVNNQVLFVAVENNMKQFVSENEVQDHVSYHWQGRRGHFMLYFPIMILYWALMLHFSFFVILFYALPRYGSKYRRFVDDVLARERCFLISYFVHVIYYLIFIIVVIYDAGSTSGILRSGTFAVTDGFVFHFSIGFILYEIDKCRMKGVKVYINSWINILDVTIALLLAIYMVTRMIDIIFLTPSRVPVKFIVADLSLASAVYAVASFLFMIRFISFLRVLPNVGPITLSFKSIILDSLSFLLVWGLLIIAFSNFWSRGYAATSYHHLAFINDCVQEMVNGSNVTAAQTKELIIQCATKIFNEVVPEPVKEFPNGPTTLILAVFGLVDKEEFKSAEPVATAFDRSGD